MRLLQRLKFALKYDIGQEFIVIPFGEKNNACRFFKYEDALEYTKKCQEDHIYYERPSVLVIVGKDYV